MVLLTTTGCLERGPVYRPVDFVADSLAHDDVPKAAEETQEMLDESDLLNDKSKMDIEKVMREGF